MTATAPTIQVRVTAVLQKLTGGEKSVEASGGTIGAILEDIDQRYPGFRAQMFDDDGKLYRFVNVYLNDEDIRYLGGTEAPVKPGDRLDILPALAGGA